MSLAVWSNSALHDAVLCRVHIGKRLPVRLFDEKKRELLVITVVNSNSTHPNSKKRQKYISTHNWQFTIVAD